MFVSNTHNCSIARNYNVFLFWSVVNIDEIIPHRCTSEVKQTKIYDARLCTSNQEKNSQIKNKLPKQLVRCVGCRYGVQKILLITSLLFNQERTTFRTLSNFCRFHLNISHTLFRSYNTVKHLHSGHIYSKRSVLFQTHCTLDSNAFTHLFSSYPNSRRIRYNFII